MRGGELAVTSFQLRQRSMPLPAVIYMRLRHNSPANFISVLCRFIARLFVQERQCDKCYSLREGGKASPRFSKDLCFVCDIIRFMHDLCTIYLRFMQPPGLYNKHRINN
jgi:hypothetical protein